MGAAARTAPFYQLGKKCLGISMELHVANRQRLCRRLQDKWKSLMSQNSAPAPSLSGVFVLLQGGSDTYRGDSDSANVFRQVKNGQF